LNVILITRYRYLQYFDNDRIIVVCVYRCKESIKKGEIN